MRNLLLICLLFVFGIAQSQIVNIPDINFKNALINHIPVIDVNGDGEIQVTEAQNANTVDVANESISDMTGIEEFVNIQYLQCRYNNLTSINISTLDSLRVMHCGANQITSLDFSNNPKMTNISCWDNLLTSINTSTNPLLETLYCSDNQITSIDISNNPNLRVLFCPSNLITNLVANNNSNLQELIFNNNQVSSIDVSDKPNLRLLYCGFNPISVIDVSNNDSITNISCNNTLITELDLSNLSKLSWATLWSNMDLSYINLKNGNNINYLEQEGPFTNLPALDVVCLDDINSNLANFIISDAGHPVSFTEYCSFSAALHNEINGTIKFDIDNNSCSTSSLAALDLMVMTHNNTDSFATFTQSNGGYILYADTGNFSTSIIHDLPSYFTASPNSVNSNFVGYGNVDNIDFCISSSQVINDVNITIVPVSPAIPGFSATYLMIYNNIGSTILNGDISLSFDDSRLGFFSASETVDAQTANSLTFNYSNLNPFEKRIIEVEFIVLTSPDVELGDTLTFTTDINPVMGDNTSSDNSFLLEQIVIGSYDPNDITCLEGDHISLTSLDNYLHYVIRFQNTGTYSATNVVVTNSLDSNLDWSTLQLKSTSHNSRILIENENQIEFIFENINLPDSTADEPNSHGFIAYKIKTKSSLSLGDTIKNTAEIFFDFNEAVVTNTAITEVVSFVGVKEHQSLNNFYIYPIPTSGMLNIDSQTKISKIEIYNKLGQLLISSVHSDNIDISRLRNGIFLCKVIDVNGNSGVKMVSKIK